LRTNYLQEGGNDRGLSLDFIQKELDEYLQFKRPMKMARNKRLKEQIYLRLLMVQEIEHLRDMKMMT